MISRSAWWLNTAIYLVSIILACFVILFVLPPDYRGGGGSVWFAFAVTALVFRILIGTILKQAQKK
jgi:hypothetical protein